MENRRSGDLIAAIVLFFVLLFAYTKILGPIQFSVNNINSTKTDSFQVQGTGKAAAAPDKAMINLGITNESSSVSIAQEKTNQTADKIVTALKNLGVAEKDIKTVGYSVNPSFDFGSSRKTGSYTVTQTFEVKVPIEKTNNAVDAATTNGANVIGNISFVLDDDKQTKLENLARVEAVAKAKAKAEGLAKAAGIRLGKIINVSESFGTMPVPLMMEAKASEGSGTPTSILPGQTSVEMTVTLTYDTF